MPLRFDCIFYYVTDLDAAVDFYCNVLGFCLASKDAVARFHVDGVLFELVPTLDRKRIDGHGNARLCLRTDNINAAVKELHEKGASVTQPQPVENGLVATVADRDGNEICLWQDAIGIQG